MPKTRNRPKPSESGGVVCFVGAGASAAECPTVIVTSNLLAEALAIKGDGQRHQAVCAELRAFLSEVYNVTDPAEIWCPSVDELLSVVDLAIATGTALAPQWGVSRLQSLRHNLLLVIYTCVHHKIHDAPGKGVLARLTAWLRQQGKPTIVSLNWDCLIERAWVRERGGDQLLKGINHHVPCYQDFGLARIVPQPDAITVLKPHGSANWALCNLCDRLSVIPGRPIDFDRPPICGGCGYHTPLELVMVPPTYSATPRPVLAAIWKAFEDTLVSADQLVFVGYSLPYQDIAVRLSLLRAIARRRATQRPALAIEVVSRAGPGADSERQRFRQLLGPDVRYQAPADGLTEWLQTLAQRPAAGQGAH